MILRHARAGANEAAHQGIVAANKEGTVSRQMVKWVSSINSESYLLVEATVQKPLEPVVACRVSHYELHITKCYMLAAAPAGLGMTLAAANKAVTNFSDEQAAVEEGVEKLSVAPSAEPAGVPAASMLTHLDNIVMHKRAPVAQAISDIRMEVKELFRSYLRSKGFKEYVDLFPSVNPNPGWSWLGPPTTPLSKQTKRGCRTDKADTGLNHRASSAPPPKVEPMFSDCLTSAPRPSWLKAPSSTSRSVFLGMSPMRRPQC